MNTAFENKLLKYKIFKNCILATGKLPKHRYQTKKKKKKLYFYIQNSKNS